MNEKKKCNDNSHIGIYKKGLVKTNAFSHNMQKKVGSVSFYASFSSFLLSSFLYFLVGFDKKVMQVCGDIMGLGAWESFQGPLARCYA
jgi:hypothetical protein